MYSPSIGKVCARMNGNEGALPDVFVDNVGEQGLRTSVARRSSRMPSPVLPCLCQSPEQLQTGSEVADADRTCLLWHHRFRRRGERISGFFVPVDVGPVPVDVF